MSKQTIKIKNIKRPSPKWFRITKHIVYGVLVTSLFTDLLQRFGVTDADVNLISGLIIAVTQTVGAILGNGDDYVKTQE